MAAAGLRFGSDPWLIAREQDEQATLGAGMLDRDPQQRFDELTEDDLAGHRLRSLDHRSDIQLLDGRANGGGGRCRDCCVAEMWMKLFELPHLAIGAPSDIAVARVPPIDVRKLFEATRRVEARGQFVGERLVVDKAVCACRADGLFVKVHGIERAAFDSGDFRPDQCGAVLEILRAICRQDNELWWVRDQSLNLPGPLRIGGCIVERSPRQRGVEMVLRPLEEG